MGCNCQIFELVLGVIILVFAFWQMAYSQWILAIAAIVLIIHSFKCKNCAAKVNNVPSKKKRR